MLPETSLRRLLEDRRTEAGGAADPLPVAHAIAYMLEVLPAFSYLHRMGLMFCDFKPDNVMQTADAIKLIDLGGVYRVDDPSSAIYGTKGYQAPEIAETGPTVASDLYTIGRTLAVLCTLFPGYQQRHEYSLPTPDDEPLFERYDSLYQVLRRATAPDPDDRFQSADELADQLYGVLREIVTAETGNPTTASSTLFTPELRAEADGPEWAGLPALLVDTNDPAAGFLASLAAADPEASLALLDGAPEVTIEVRLRRVRVLLDAEDFDPAALELRRISDDDPWEWRAAWYQGLERLARDDARGAIPAFEAVYHAVPGELAPKLALGAAHELAGQYAEAGHWYDIVSRTDRAFPSAAFGLARCRLAVGDLDGTLVAYERIPSSSSAYHAAQIAIADALLDERGSTDPGRVTTAARVVAQLRAGSEERAQLTARVLSVALSVASSQGAPPDARPVLGASFDEPGLRVGLEAAYRDLARYASDTETRFTWIDRANDVRPRTLT